MANKRQREARKKFILVNGPEAATKVKKRSAEEINAENSRPEKKLKGNKNDSHTNLEEGCEGISADTKREAKTKTKDEKKKTGARVVKHPLRVPGMRPGESCFICKDTGHLAKDCPMKSERDRKKMCLHCRQWGHTMKNCPNNQEEEGETRHCYNCGEKGHSLSSCPKPTSNGGTTFAACFLCQEKGHLSRDCPKNTHGVYPKGGCCKICQGVNHLAKDCPDKEKLVAPKAGKLRINSTEAAPASLPGGGGKRIIFSSGDDLEDDFTEAFVPNYGEDADLNHDDQIHEKSKDEKIQAGDPDDPEMFDDGIDSANRTKRSSSHSIKLSKKKSSKKVPKMVKF